MSEDIPNLPVGVRLRILFRRVLSPATACWDIGNSFQPGAMAFTRTPFAQVEPHVGQRYNGCARSSQTLCDSQPETSAAASHKGNFALNPKCVS